MLTPKQIKIFGTFLRHPYEEKTFKEIKSSVKEKSNSLIQHAIAAFIKNELITKRSIGNNILYKPNLDNSAVFSYFDIIIRERIPHLAKLSLQIIKDEVKNIPFTSLVIFGSYAEGKQKEKSDLDIAIFVNTKEDKKECELAMHSVKLKCILTIDSHVITKDEMLEMLTNNEENLGKQIAKKHLTLQNSQIFYSMVDEGIRRGFKIIHE